jgi:hypothetical protein
MGLMDVVEKGSVVNPAVKVAGIEHDAQYRTQSESTVKALGAAVERVDVANPTKNIETKSAETASMHLLDGPAAGLGAARVQNESAQNDAGTVSETLSNAPWKSVGGAGLGAEIDREPNSTRNEYAFCVVAPPSKSRSKPESNASAQGSLLNMAHIDRSVPDIAERDFVRIIQRSAQTSVATDTTMKVVTDPGHLADQNSSSANYQSSDISTRSTARIEQEQIGSDLYNGLVTDFVDKIISSSISDLNGTQKETVERKRDIARRG